MLTKLKIVDNSGALFGRLIKILNKKSSLKLGRLILVSIIKNIPNSKIRKGEIHKAIIVNNSNNNFVNKINIKRSCILVKTKKNDLIPLGTRSKGIFCSSLKNVLNSEKILSLSKKII